MQNLNGKDSDPDTEAAFRDPVGYARMTIVREVDKVPVLEARIAELEEGIAKLLDAYEGRFPIANAIDALFPLVGREVPRSNTLDVFALRYLRRGRFRQKDDDDDGS